MAVYMGVAAVEFWTFVPALEGVWASDAEEYVGIDPNTRVPSKIGRSSSWLLLKFNVPAFSLMYLAHRSEAKY